MHESNGGIVDGDRLLRIVAHFCGYGCNCHSIWVVFYGRKAFNFSNSITLEDIAKDVDHVEIVNNLND